MFTRTFSALAGATMAAGMLALSTPLFAAETNQETAIVQVGDLNLASAAGMARFERRVGQAARRVCGEIPTLDLNMQRHVRSCQDQVRASAKSELQLASTPSSRGARS